MVPPLPHAREPEGWPVPGALALAADFAGLLAWRKGTLGPAGLLSALASKSSLAAFPQPNSATVTCELHIRLTVARRRRFLTVFPSTNSAVVVEGRRPLRVSLISD